MRAVIVYESMFGNTREVAEAIAEGLRRAVPSATVEVASVATAQAEDAGLLVVGGPTHAMGLSRPRTRAGRDGYLRTDADRERVERQPGADQGPGVREWLARLPRDGEAWAAAFDTRVSAMIPGHAAPAIGRRLLRAGYTVLADPVGFVVETVTGPLRAGEADRARAWGEELGSSWVAVAGA